jgi:hypothetical protein
MSAPFEMNVDVNEGEKTTIQFVASESGIL